MIFGLTIEKLVVIGVIAALLLGPERIPRYAQMLAQLTVRARDLLNGAKSRMREEMGDDFDDVDWRKLDPRQYDPRRIIREALLDDAPTPARPAATTAPTPPVGTERQPFRPGDTPPFDSEAT
ncbi:MAG: Sec-independent protein translocase TatB [Microbacterium sp.]|uniref:Sec-independent protein translocase TatB n=1 Tax=Microbacterium sp. TaxID=51671 RepID=UPI001ACE09A6|nr:Sec-independent protein translocase TatB [Microbacterium sp.]MBN9153116.1 Sec-independent protein translocase TatB [Microbacterium sp.]MBN9171922.1 Sec-independent protein translocase TatB [Microbacterium sp.]MBN9174191.1 Sec-independent protein translocase TatB [Microbacterium sp.]